ncbi:MAG: hypothetical protein EHM21_09370 [Chloroflexi bacterium]|nr:MAG: hypothetical protein EHM21_09370 [Chloroflexota bacterium]
MICISLSLLLWIIPYRQLGYPTALAFLYLVTILITELIVVISLWSSLTGQLSWKGRKLCRPRWKWL